MDNLTLAQKLLGKEKTTEKSSETVNPSGASIVYMIAVTSSSNGEVVLKDEIESTADWNEEDIIEIDDDGGFEEYDIEEDPLEDVDDSVVDMTDGDGVDIEDTDYDSVSFSVADYRQAAMAAYEEEFEVVEDDLPDENAEIGDDIDDGDAESLPDVGIDDADDLTDENAAIEDLADDEYEVQDFDSNDESDEPLNGAETSDGYTVANCIGSVKEGDRVVVAIQDGNPIVIGVVGSGDEEEALRKQAEEAAEEAGEAAEDAKEKAEQAEGMAAGAAQDTTEAKRQADAANEAATNAQNSANQALTEAQEATQKALDAESKADTVEKNMAAVNAEVSNIKENAINMRSELETQIETVRTNAEKTFATKSETATIETTLRSEFAESIAGIQSSFSQDYAKKTELEDAIVTAKASLQTQITQNANTIASTARSVEEMQVDITAQDGKIAQAQQAAADAQTTANQAKTDAEEAQTAANQAKSQANTANTAATNAQTEADEAKAKAEAAQTLADQAKKDLATAESKLAEVEGNALANAEDIEKAQQAVEEAKTAVQTAQSAADKAKADAAAAQTTADQAKSDAAKANTAAGNAQAKADEAKTAASNAQKAADEAKEDLEALESRVITAETTIEQHSEAIALRATKEEVTALTKRVSAAEQKITADAIISTVSGTYLTKTDASNNYATKTSVSTLSQTVDSITGRIADAEGNISTLTQTASGLQISLNTTNSNVTAAQNAANAANTAAGAAQTTANTARTEAANAAKTATNFLTYDATNYLQIGNKQNGSWSGFRSQITPNAFNILDASGKKRSSYGVNDVLLGISDSGDANVKISSSNNKSTIDLCYGVAKMEAVEVDTNDYQGSITNFILKSNDVMLIDAPKQMSLTSNFEDDGSLFWTSISQLTQVMGDPYVEITAGREIGESYNQWTALLFSKGFMVNDFLGDMYFHMTEDDGITLRSNKDININTTGDGIVYLNGHRVMKAKLPEGGYWGMVVPTGTDTNFIRTTVSGLIPYAQENTSKIGTASYRFSEGNFDTLRAHTSLCTGSKTSATGNATGAVLANTGRLFLQNTTGNSYVQFYGPSTDKGCYISYNIETERLMFGGAGVNQFSFGQKIYTSGTIQSDGAIYSGGAVYAGYGSDWSTARGIYMPFKDGTNHSVVYRDSDGLTIYYGWGGSSTNKSVAILRGYTVKYQNSSGATALSDERLKKDFTNLDRWNDFFDMIEPCAFKMKNGSSDRYHIGYKAQQIEEALLKAGLSTSDFAGFVKMPYREDPENPELAAVYEEAGIKTGDNEYGLVYSEFTALNTYKIQKLEKRIKELETLVDKLLPI